MSCSVIGGCGLQRVALGQGAYAYRCAVSFAVIGEGAARGGYHDLVCILGNRQRAGGCRSNFVEITGINLTHSALGEVNRVHACICLGSGCGDTLEGHTIGCSGIAANSLLCAVVGEGARISLKGHILIIIEDDLIFTGSNGHGLFSRGHGGTTLNINGEFVIGLPKGATGHGLGIGNRLGGTVPVVVDRIAQVVPDGPGTGEGHVFVGHDEGVVRHGGVGGVPAGEGVAVHGGLIFHGHGVAVGVGFLTGGIRCSVGNFAGIAVGHLEVSLFPVGNEAQVAGRALGDDNRLVGLVAAAGGSCAHGPAKELIALPLGILDPKVFGKDRIGLGVGVRVVGVGPSGLYGIVVIVEIVGNRKFLQRKFEDNHVLGVVGGQNGSLGGGTVHDITLRQQHICLLVLVNGHREGLGRRRLRRSAQNGGTVIPELDRICKVRQGGVDEGDYIVNTALQNQSLFRRVDNVLSKVAGRHNRLGNDLRADFASERALSADYFTFIGQILHGVFNVLALNNLGVDGGILGQRLVEVKGSLVCLVLVPAGKIIAGKQVRRHIFRLAIVGNLHGRLAAIGILVLHNELKLYRVRFKLGVQGQVVTGHGGEGIGVAHTFGIVIPALELIHLGKADLIRGIKVIVTGVDIHAEADIGLGFQNCGAVVIRYLGNIPIVVEFENRNAIFCCFFIQVPLMSVAIDFFGVQAGTIGVVVCLGILCALFIVCTIFILQPVLNSVFR